MNKKKLIPIIAVIIMSIVAISLVLVIIKINVTCPSGVPYPGVRKAIIVGSANDFYDSETEDYSGGNDATFETNKGNWSYVGSPNSADGYSSLFNYTTNGSIFIQPLDLNPIQGIFTLNYSYYYKFKNYAYYNFTAHAYIQTIGAGIDGKGVYIYLEWLNSSGGTVKIDKSKSINSTVNQWFSINISGVCNNETGNEISDLKINLCVEGTFAGGGIDRVFFDDLLMETWLSVNLTNPTDPNPPHNKKDSDGFPAQALQVYWILKRHGYTDDNIFFMLYHKNDNVIDIDKFDAIANDLTNASIDVEDDDVNASRFKRELNVSIAGSFASKLKPNDQLIIFMTDHGSNQVLTDGNATFHFEADNSYITEFEFYNLVKQIPCEKMMINVDCCFSGNFLNENKNIGASWYDLPNCLFISASSNVFSWYWIDNNNGDGFAGSWFFHPFWDQLDKNSTIINAFNFAINFIPWQQFRPMAAIQAPLMHDNLGINGTWSFNSNSTRL
ncbi:MAG: C13 family peptidase [Promethearchaeota archaeon]